jgi:hypothetical protein
MGTLEIDPIISTVFSRPAHHTNQNMSSPNNSLKKLDAQRRHAWRSYFEVQGLLYNAMQENARLSQQMHDIVQQPIMDGIIPNHFKAELVQNLKELDCPVCLETMTHETFTLTKCFHKICKPCRDQLQHSGLCPMCRKNL